MRKSDWTKTYRKKWKEMRRWTKGFGYLALLNYLILIILAITPIVQQHTDVYIYLRTCLFITIIIFQVFQVASALFFDNVYELYSGLVTQVVITVLIILRILLAREWSIYNIILFSYAVMFQLAYFSFAMPVHDEYNRMMFDKIGADQEYRDVFKRYLLFNALLKLDFLMTLINLMSFGIYFKNYWYILYITGFFIAAVLFLTGRFGVKQEKLPLLISFWIMSLTYPIFIGYEVKYFISQNLFQEMAFPNKEQIEIFIFHLVAFISAFIFICLRIALVTHSFFVFRNFGKGILPKHQKSSEEADIFSQSKETTTSSDLTVSKVINATKRQQQQSAYSSSYIYTPTFGTFSNS